jgi:hypothetical protein
VIEPTGWLLDSFYDNEFDWYVPVQLENGTLAAVLRSDVTFEDDTWVDPTYNVSLQTCGHTYEQVKICIGDIIELKAGVSVKDDNTSGWLYVTAKNPERATVTNVAVLSYYGDDLLRIYYQDLDGHTWYADPSDYISTVEQGANNKG